jgi:hypothetical protein
LLAIGGFVAGAYIAGDLHDPARVVLGAIVALGPGQLVSLSIWRRRPWDALVASQLWSYEKPDGPGDLNAIIHSEDFERASKALRLGKVTRPSYSGSVLRVISQSAQHGKRLSARATIAVVLGLRRAAHRR